MTVQDRTVPAGPRPVGRHRGTAVHEIALASPDGLQARILTFGAVIRDLSLPMPAGGRQSLVLGFPRFEPYPRHSPYFGALVGRYANRIAGGRFTLGGETNLLDRNEGGTTTLHGGQDGFARRVWKIVDHSERHVTLGLDSPHGDQGFPGRLTARCRYTLGPGSRLEVALRARADRPTPVNLSQHSYFNLEGTADVSDHLLTVHADNFTPVGPGKIPTGEILPVAGTPYDLRQPRRLGEVPVDLDHNFVLSPGTDPSGLRPAAELASPRTGLRLHVATTKPGVQIYDGHLLDVAVPGLDGRRYGSKAGLCIETQHFPDSPNRTQFPDPVLAPGTEYDHRTVYAFHRL